MKHALFTLLSVLLIVQAHAQTSDYSFIKEEQNHIYVNDSNTLLHFFEQSQKLGKEKLRIAHIGDSHVQTGWMGNRVERSLKTFFEDEELAEKPLIFPYKLAKTHGENGVRINPTEGNWTSCRNVFLENDCEWGLCGMTVTSQDRAAGFSIEVGDNAAFDKLYLFHTRSTKYVQCKPSAGFMISNRYVDSIQATEIVLSEPNMECRIDIDGSLNDFNLRGITLCNEAPTLSMGSFGVNGAEVKSFLYSPMLENELAFLQPDLVMVSLGTNDTYSSEFDANDFEKQMDSLLVRIKRGTPKASVLLTTPPDCKRYRKYTNKNNLIASDIIKQLAVKHNCAVYDLFNIMGGLGSIDAWYNASLATKDKVHFTKKGYELQADYLSEALIEQVKGYEQFLASKVVSPTQQNGLLDKLNGFFVYDASQPLLFTSYIFLALFTLFFGFYLVFYKKVKQRNMYLLLFSLFFYYKAGGYYFVLLLLSTVIDFFIGNKMHAAKHNRGRKRWLIASVSTNLLLLGFFKYSYLVVDGINYVFQADLEVINWFAVISNNLLGTGMDTASIFLPIGISFYTFQTLSYSIDIYRKKITPVKTIWDFAFFVSFFPQLVAGPIVRAADFMPQLYKKYQLNKDDFIRAICLISLGIVKKVMVSDYIASNFVDRVFENPSLYTGLENLLASYGYAIQIFCDFSGYSDIAIGLALLLGFQLPANFNAPYLATNITEFWRKWHISLSSWLKDYLYISLGGNRKGKLKTYRNLFLTMFLGGLWHGAAFRFILWGVLHGVALAAHKLLNNWFPNRPKGPISRAFGWILTFHFVVFTFVLFRAPELGTVQMMFQSIFTSFQLEGMLEVLIAHKTILSVMLVGFLLQTIPDALQVRTEFNAAKGLKWIGIAVALFGVVFLAHQFNTAGSQPFIYFQF